MKLTNCAALLLASTILPLSACNKKSPQITADNGNSSLAPDPIFTPPSQASNANSNSSANAKLDAYIDAHNKLVGTFGFPDTANDYRKENISGASPNGNFNIRAGWIGQGVAKLKSARAMSGGAGDLDAAADALIASMGKADGHLTNLSTYYSSKKYLDDKLARGKAEDPQMLAELSAAEKDLQSFNAILDRETDKRDQALLDQLKSSGDMLKYNTKLALVHAKRLADLFNSPADANNQTLIAKGDAEVVTIEQAIAGAHDAASKAGKSDPSGLSSLTSMVGDYRALKQGHAASDLQSMMDDYNRAVEAENTFGSME